MLGTNHMAQKMQQWYFVQKIDLTYHEKKNLVIKIFFLNSRLKTDNFQIVTKNCSDLSLF